MDTASRMHAAEPSLLLISGAPASGKSSVARALAQRLGFALGSSAFVPFALVSKDALKETLYDTLGAELAQSGYDTQQLSRRLSEAAMELLWTVARGCPHVILEANFRPRSAHERGRLAALAHRKLELYCYCSPVEAQRRFAARADGPGRHPAHSLRSMSPEMVAEYNGPVGMGPVIRIDTTQPLDIEAVIAAIQQYWPDISCAAGEAVQ